MNNLKSDKKQLPGNIKKNLNCESNTSLDIR